MKRPRLLTRIDMSLSYMRDLRTTPPGEREGLPQLQWWKLPACWIRGHIWQGSSGCIDGYSLQYCLCCNQEIAGRTSWSQIEPRPDDDEPWHWYDDPDDDS